MRKPTIYEALRTTLQREPTNAELRDAVRRIKGEAVVALATWGGLAHQRKRRRK